MNYFEWVTEGLLIFIVGIIGLFGNGVSVWTFWRQRVHRIFHNLLLILAIFDMVSDWSPPSDLCKKRGKKSSNFLHCLLNIHSLLFFEQFWLLTLCLHIKLFVYIFSSKVSCLFTFYDEFQLFIYNLAFKFSCLFTISKLRWNYNRNYFWNFWTKIRVLPQCADSLLSLQKF